MKRRFIAMIAIAIVLVVAILLVSLSHRSTNPGEQVNIIISTSMGEIEVVLDGQNAPRTVSNFLRYVEADQYRGGRFHRTVTLENQPHNEVKIEVI